MLACLALLLAVQDTVRFTPTVGHPTFAVRENIVDPAYTVIAKYPKKYLPR